MQRGGSMQREILRIHELWQKAKRDLAAKEAELSEWKDRCVPQPPRGAPGAFSGNILSWVLADTSAS